MTEIRCVDVVVDVPTARLDGPFTYAVGGEAPHIGARVRVPLGGRKVYGWVISEPVIIPDGAALKPIESIEEEEPRFDVQAVRLAAWLRRRYACTYREALSAVAPRARAGASQGKYAFVSSPAIANRIAYGLFRRLGTGSFAPRTARRALRTIGLAVTLAGLHKELGRLVRLGMVRRIERAGQPARRRRSGSAVAVLVNAAAAKGRAQMRMARVLGDAGGTIPATELRRRANAGAETLRRAQASGVIRLEERAPLRATETHVAGYSFVPTDEQRDAIDLLDGLMQRGSTTALLHGVTGSGKTFVYSRIVDRVRARGGRAIILVPEIALTPQTAARFEAAFGAAVGVLHSGLSDSQRAAVWNAASAGALDVVVGARSAVFAPLPGLALIVVDEEHEPSYKQDVAPRYDAATVARERMALLHGSVILGSATPSLETYWEARSGAIAYVRMRGRATAAPLPPVEVIGMSADQSSHARRPLGPTLAAAIDDALARREKVMLFVNRRGYAGLLLCRACGFVPKCRRCAVSLVVHAADRSIRCHVCGTAFSAPASCPKCGSEDLRPFGFGTQRVEQEVRELFPTARVVRMDSDTTSARGAHGSLLHSFAAEGDVLIGTQMIAKGLDFSSLTLVGVVSADIDLHRPDFRAAERTFQLLTQVAGRAGRTAAGSRVIVQTYSPEHYAIEFAAQHDYERFAEKELDLRRELKYPPFGRLAYIGVAGVSLPLVSQIAANAAQELRSQFSSIQVLGPAPDPLPKARGEYRMRIAIKAQQEAMLLDACAAAQAVKTPPEARLTVIADPR
jgi:primosomal protein N' (replication factor Y)